MALFSTLTDNFDDNSRDVTKWTSFNSPQESNGQLVIPLTAGATLYKGYDSINFFDLTASYVYAELVDAGSQSLTTLEVYPVGVFNAALTDGFQWRVSNGLIEALKRVSSTTTTVASATYDYSLHKFFRIREAGGTTFFDFSTDGITYTNVGSVANPFAVTSLFVEMTAGTYGSEVSSTTVRIDNFNTPPVIPDEPEDEEAASASAFSEDLPKKYLYKVSRNGTFLGVLQNVVSSFGYSQSINTPGTSLNVTLGNSADTSHEAVQPILTETGEVLTDELGQTLYTERTPDFVGDGNEAALVRNNNDVDIYEYSAYYPNGKHVFSGYISRWQAKFGGDDNVTFTILSHGQELDNYVIFGQPTDDVVQGDQDTSIRISGAAGFGRRMGQVFIPGDNITNLYSITLMLAAVSSASPATFIVNVWTSPAGFFTGSPVGTATLTVTSETAAEYEFIFDTPIDIVGGVPLFFSVQEDSGTNDGMLYYESTDTYNGGDGYISTWSPSSGWSVWATTSGSIVVPFDLFFATKYSSLATSTPYSNEDPTQIVRQVMDSYIDRGGTIGYTTGSTDLTGLYQSYEFKINTVLEGIKKMRDLSPANWYWYVDVAANRLYFKETLTTVDHTMILGNQINNLEILSTIENIKNRIYFSGGDIGGGVNLFVLRDDTEAIAANNGRIGLERKTDNRVTIQATAEAIVDSFLEENSRETQETTITIIDQKYDITSFAVGQIVGFAGFGNFVDDLALQIVKIDRREDDITLTLGVLPKRQNAKIEEINRQLLETQTVDNPSVPS